MSLNAYVWAASLPLDLLSATAFRVLLKYADGADQHGRTAWRTAAEVAVELQCSPRTVQRAIRELVAQGILIEGDQSYVAHIRADRRPVVFDINMTGMLPQQLPIGTTPSVTPHGTTDSARYDRSGLHDTTAAVAHRTVIEPSNTLDLLSTERYDKNVVPYIGVQPAPRIPRVRQSPEGLAPCIDPDGHAFRHGVCQRCEHSREDLRGAAS